MLFFYLDASALAKSYVNEKGTSLMNFFFDRVPLSQMMALIVSLSETISIFVRKKNGGIISQPVYRQTLSDFKNDIVENPDFLKISVEDDLVYDSMTLIEKYSINATDAIILQSCIDITNLEREDGNDLILVTSDRRLQSAAEAEGIRTINPEVDSLEKIERLIQFTASDENEGKK
jgi:predicted nucleic acid-binding protein